MLGTSTLGFLVSDGALWFSVPAVAGTVYFALSFIMGAGDDLLDAGGEVDFGDGDSPGAEFRVLSLQTISAFCLGSGWTGLAALRMTELGFGGSVVVALLAGVGVAWLLVWLLRSALKLQSSGNVSIQRTLGLEGTIEVGVPEAGAGRGRVAIVIGNQRREFNAIQEGTSALPSRTPVRVVRVDRSSNTVVVELAG